MDEEKIELLRTYPVLFHSSLLGKTKITIENVLSLSRKRVWIRKWRHLTLCASLLGQWNKS
jgi:hypothetical protein